MALMASAYSYYVSALVSVKSILKMKIEGERYSNLSIEHLEEMVILVFLSRNMLSLTLLSPPSPIILVKNSPQLLHFLPRRRTPSLSPILGS
jgi:hypothetical protein